MQQSLFYDEHFNEGRPWPLENIGYPFLYHMYWADKNRLWHRNTIFKGYNDSGSEMVKNKVSNYVFSDDVDEIVTLVTSIEPGPPQITLCTKLCVSNIEKLNVYINQLT